MQRLMSRWTRTLLPIRDTQLKLKVVQNVTESKQARGQTVKQHYDARARNMTALLQGQMDQDTQWSLGMCIDQLSERSYVVLVNGKTYRRNRKDICPVPEKLEISPTGERTTLDSDWYPELSFETEQQVTEGAVVPEGSQDAEGLHTRTRSNIQKPLRYKDYVP